jgi:uncharacterized membrane protein YbhN (UPF0104 family)
VYKTILPAHLIHNFYVHVIPAGLGEVSFPILLKKEITTEASVSALVILRLGLLSVTVLFLFVSVMVLFGWTSLFQFELYQLIPILFAILILFLLVKFRKNLFQKIERIKIFKKFTVYIRSVLLTIKNDLVRMKNYLFLAKVLIYMIMSFVSILLFYLVIMKGISIELSFFQVVFISSIGIVFMILPIKSIGGFGTTEGSWALGMMLLGYGKEIAIQSGFVVHIYALVNVFLFFLLGVSFKYFLLRNKTTS